MKIIIIAVTFFLFAFSADAQQNMLTPQEKKEGWKLLFDGKSLTGWHLYGKDDVGTAWQIKDETLMLNAPVRSGNKALGGGDLVTNEVFKGDFEFKVEWKVSALANSGVFLFVEESPAYKEIYHTGLEIQVTDNNIHKNAKADNKHRAGDIFGIVSTSITEVNPVGEWNQLHVIHQKDKLKVFMNGFELHHISLSSAEWKTMVSDSALKNAPFAKGKYTGRIGLQDWGSTVWYRNIKIKHF